MNKDRCNQCKKGKIGCWSMEKSGNKLLCEGCALRKDSYVIVSNMKSLKIIKSKIKTWIRKAMKDIIGITERIYEYQNYIDNQFIDQEDKLVELQINFYPIYYKFLQLSTKVDQAFLNLNNLLDNWNFPQTNLEFSQNKNDQIETCKKLIVTKDIFAAQQQIQNLENLDNYTSKYFKIECLLLQKELNEASKESEIITKIAQSENEFQKLDQNILFNLLLQKAKIKHKQGLYIQALQTLVTIETQEVSNHNKKRLNLQISKTMQKSGNFQEGYKLLQLTIENQNNSTQLDKESEKNDYSIDYYLFRLAYAKAKLLNLDFGLNQISIQHQSFYQLNNDIQPLIQENDSAILNIDNSQYNDIENLYKQILQQDPLNQKALYGLSQIYIKLNEIQKARKILLKINQLYPLYKKAEIGLLFCKQKQKLIQQNNEQNSVCQSIFGYLIGKICCYFKENIRQPEQPVQIALALQPIQFEQDQE